jgi:hypothetical protein
MEGDTRGRWSGVCLIDWVLYLVGWVKILIKVEAVSKDTM